MHEHDDAAERMVGTREFEAGTATPPAGSQAGRVADPAAQTDQPAVPTGATRPPTTQGVPTTAVRSEEMARGPLGVPPPPGAEPARQPRVRAIPSVAAINGHPLHPMLVPLPIGSFSLAVLSDIAFARTHDRFWARMSNVLLKSGIISGLVAAALGATDFLGRPPIREHREAWLHAGGNLAAVGLATASLRARRHRSPRSMLPMSLAVSAVLGNLLLITGWLGGELSYRYRVGVVPD